jgi:3-dehydroquinate dehydratase type I
LPAEKLSDLTPLIRRAEDSGADLIEIRLDYIGTDVSNAIDELGKVIKKASVPLIATNRQYQQGGHHPQDEEQRIKTLVKAAALGFQYVDVELTTAKLKATVQRVKDYGAKPIVSHHDLKGTPAESEMEKIVKSQIEAGTDTCKLVTTAIDVADSIRCLVLTRRMSEITKIVCFAMGRKGALSRAFSPFFGAYFTFASLESGVETALGQMSISDLKELYRRLGANE